MMDCVAAARGCAEKACLKILPKRNSAGEVINYQVFRVMPDRLVFVGSRASPKALLSLVEKLAERRAA